jgi:hypothetical protein
MVIQLLLNLTVLFRCWSSGLSRVALHVVTNISEEHSASIFRVIFLIISVRVSFKFSFQSGAWGRLIRESCEPLEETVKYISSRCAPVSTDSRRFSSTRQFPVLGGAGQMRRIRTVSALRCHRSRPHARMDYPVPQGTCVASDALSRLIGCTVSSHRMHCLVSLDALFRLIIVSSIWVGFQKCHAI